MITNKIYSIGYATKPLERFIKQLQEYSVDAVADVRSVPYSKIFHDYHRESLAASLKEAGMHYVYLGEELGPRSKQDEHYDEHNQVQFGRLMQSEQYLLGVERLLDGLGKGMRIALLCAEKDPAECHRSLLIGYYFLRQKNIVVQHITHAGELESQLELEKRLLALHDLGEDLFASMDEQIQRAWQMQTRAKAYRRSQQ